MPALYLPTRWLITSDPSIDDPDVFPTLIGQTFIVGKTPTWSTGIATAVSGRERRRKLWSYPKWTFQVSYEVLRDLPSTPDLRRLLAFFNIHGGQYREFFFLDPSDNTVTAEPFGTGDGVTTAFRLTRSMAFGSESFVEPIGGLMGTPTVFVAGSPVAAFTVGDNGWITFTSPPASGAALTWTGQFMFVCRFIDDAMEVAQMMASLWSQSGLSFQSVKA